MILAQPHILSLVRLPIPPPEIITNNRNNQISGFTFIINIGNNIAFSKNFCTFFAFTYPGLIHRTCQLASFAAWV
jgi:hypothetical protein